MKVASRKGNGPPKSHRFSDLNSYANINYLTTGVDSHLVNKKEGGLQDKTLPPRH